MLVRGQACAFGRFAEGRPGPGSGSRFAIEATGARASEPPPVRSLGWVYRNESDQGPRGSAARRAT